MATVEWLLVLAVIVGVGFVFYEMLRPRKRVFRSLEEERAYQEQMGRMKAEEDYRENYRRHQQQQREVRKYPFGRSMFEDSLFGSRKSKKRKNYL